MTRTLALLLAVVAAGCSANAGRPPAIQIDRTVCARCTMLVSERQFAAAYRSGSGEARVFDDIGCLLAAVAEEAAAGEIQFWFHDAGTGEWIRGEEAVFVKSSALQTPMSGGIVAYRTRQDAEQAAGARQGRVIRSLGELLALGVQESGS